MGPRTIDELNTGTTSPIRRLDTFGSWTVWAVAGGVTALLLCVADRYGYHRDELYFLVAGHHLAWGYPDQPPLVPVLARILSDVAPGSLVLLRTPSALAAGAVVVLSALSARELGAGRAAQVLAAGIMASGAVLYGAGHLLSPATFYIAATATLLWLVLRALRTGDNRLWLFVGLVAGVGLLDDDLVAFVMAAVVFGIVTAGPRRTMRSPWFWAGGVAAVLMWLPYLAWQAGHGWPEITVAGSIASGHSGSSTPRSLFVPEQLILLNVWLTPVWVVGLARLLRDRTLGWARSVGIGWVFLAVAFLVTDGKSYYLAGTFPLLLGAGAQPAMEWIRRHNPSTRRRVVGTGLALGFVGAVFFTLPVVPVGMLHDTPIVAVNYDLGETVAWPQYVAEIAAVYREFPPNERPSTVIITSNYGEAGAVDRYGAAHGLPEAYSVHNGFWYWGPPPDRDMRAVAVGFTGADVTRFCSAPIRAARLTNPWKVDNQEEGAPIWMCTSLRGSWSRLWSEMKVIR